MQWEKELYSLEQAKDWDFAIKLMQDVIDKNPHNMKAYMFMNFLLMNLLAFEQYEDSKFDFYNSLAKKYFKESYAKFSNNAQYLYYMGIIAEMSEWFFDIDRHFIDQMVEKAITLDPKNSLYKFDYFWHLFKKNENIKEVIMYARIFFDDNSDIVKELKVMGFMGEYILNIRRFSCKEILKLDTGSLKK